MDTATQWHWQFIFRTEEKGETWAWQRVGPDGVSLASVGTHGDYGKAVSDAIRNGFRPREEPWTITDGSRSTHYAAFAQPSTARASDGDRVNRAAGRNGHRRGPDRRRKN